MGQNEYWGGGVFDVNTRGLSQSNVALGSEVGFRA